MNPVSVSTFSAPLYADFYEKQGTSFTVSNKGVSPVICKVQTTLPERYSVYPSYFTLGPRDCVEVLLMLELTPAERGIDHAFCVQAMAISRREREVLLDPAAVGESARMYRRFWEDHYPGARFRGQVLELTVRPDLRPGAPAGGASRGAANEVAAPGAFRANPGLLRSMRSMRAAGDEGRAALSRQRAELRQDLVRLAASAQTLEQTIARDRMLCAKAEAEASRLERELRAAERLRGSYRRLRIYKYEFSVPHVAMAAMGGLLAGLVLQLKARGR